MSSDGEVYEAARTVLMDALMRARRDMMEEPRYVVMTHRQLDALKRYPLSTTRFANSTDPLTWYGPMVIAGDFPLHDPWGLFCDVRPADPDWTLGDYRWQWHDGHWSIDGVPQEAGPTGV